MKRFLPLLILAFTLCNGSGAFGQFSNLIFFSENGERFTVILNGIRQNPNPETNVKVTELPAPSYKLKVIFEDAALGQFDKNLMFKSGRKRLAPLSPHTTRHTLKRTKAVSVNMQQVSEVIIDPSL